MGISGVVSNSRSSIKSFVHLFEMLVGSHEFNTIKFVDHMMRIIREGILSNVDRVVSWVVGLIDAGADQFVDNEFSSVDELIEVLKKASIQQMQFHDTIDYITEGFDSGNINFDVLQIVNAYLSKEIGMSIEKVYELIKEVALEEGIVQLFKKLSEQISEKLDGTMSESSIPSVEGVGVLLYYLSNSDIPQDAQETIQVVLQNSFDSVQGRLKSLIEDESDWEKK